MSDSFRQVGADELTGTDADAYSRSLNITHKAEATYTREGIRAALQASMPARGDVIETIGTLDMIVTKVSINDAGKGPGAVLTVEAESASLDESAEYEPIGSPQYSVKYQELRRKIEAHPCCGKLVAGKSWDDWQDLKSADYQETTDAIISFYGIEPWTFAHYTSLKKQGTDEYVVYLPVVTRRWSYTGRPLGVGVQSGRQSPPPTGSFDAISDYEWLCGPDEIDQRGSKWERLTSWMACETVSDLIYPEEA